MKKNFAAQPEVVDVITGRDMVSEINPYILNGEDIFLPSNNFSSKRCFDSGGSTGGVKSWWEKGLELLNTGLETYTQTERTKSDIEQAKRAEEIAKLELQLAEEERKKQEIKSEIFVNYGVPLIIGVSITALLITVALVRKK